MAKAIWTMVKVICLLVGKLKVFVEELHLTCVEWVAKSKGHFIVSSNVQTGTIHSRLQSLHSVHDDVEVWNEAIVCTTPNGLCMIHTFRLSLQNCRVLRIPYFLIQNNSNSTDLVTQSGRGGQGQSSCPQSIIVQAKLPMNNPSSTLDTRAILHFL